MKRTRKPAKPEGEVFRWVKNGGGTFRLRNGTIIKPNQVFDAAEIEIPSAFKDLVTKVDRNQVSLTPNRPIKSKGVRTARKDKSNLEHIDARKAEFEVIEEEDGTFSVRFKTTGKKINEKPLTKVEASQLAEDLDS